MDEEVFNMQVRKFLKNVGVNAQREIETAVRTALEKGDLTGDESLKAKVVLTVEPIGLSEQIEGKIDLE